MFLFVSTPPPGIQTLAVSSQMNPALHLKIKVNMHKTNMFKLLLFSKGESQSECVFEWFVIGLQPITL
mgnify:CR=1 FL=1